MKVVAYNASPRKHWNTAMLLEEALKGAAGAGAETELIHLCDIDYTGCISCFECKKKGGKSYGRCAVKDELSPLLKSFAEADAVIFGSPIYFYDVTGRLRSFLERLWFQYLIYTDEPERSLFKGSIKTLFVYTSNAPEAAIKNLGFISVNEKISEMLFHGGSGSYFCAETLQFDDYSKYVFNSFDPEERIKRRNEIFPEQLKEIYEMGKGLAVKR